MTEKTSSLGKDQETRDKKDKVDEALESFKECCLKGFCGTSKCPGCGHDKDNTVK